MIYCLILKNESCMILVEMRMYKSMNRERHKEEEEATGEALEKVSGISSVAEASVISLAVVVAVEEEVEGRDSSLTWVEMISLGVASKEEEEEDAQTCPCGEVR